MLRSTLARLMIMVGLAISATGGLAETALAETEASTGVSVMIVDAGSLAITWSGEAPVFTVDGAAPVLDAATPGVIATATMSLRIDDTRAEPSRTGYAISLRATSFHSSDVTTSIDPSALSIVGVTGLLGESSGSTVIGATLESPVTIVTVDGVDPAVSTTVTLTIAMRIGPELGTGTYQGSFGFDVLPIAAP